MQHREEHFLKCTWRMDCRNCKNMFNSCHFTFHCGVKTTQPGAFSLPDDFWDIEKLWVLSATWQQDKTISSVSFHMNVDVKVHDDVPQASQRALHQTECYQHARENLLMCRFRSLKIRMSGNLLSVHLLFTLSLNQTHTFLQTWF